MKRTHLKLLIKTVDGRLTEREARKVRDLLERYPSYRLELEQYQQLGRYLASRPSPEFRPYFADRVLQRLNKAEIAATADEFVGLLVYQFKRVALAACIAVLGLTAYNVTVPSENSGEQSTIEAVLALRPLSVDTAFSLDLSDELYER